MDAWVNGVNEAVLRAWGHSATGDCVCVLLGETAASWGWKQPIQGQQQLR